MEFLLLWADEIDDAMGALRHLAPRALGLIAAMTVFFTAVLAMMTAPHITLAIFAVLFSAALVELVRRRRSRIAADRRR